MALALTRRKGEVLVLITDAGEKIEIKVNEIESTQVKISVEAPITTKIYREELYNRINSE